MRIARTVPFALILVAILGGFCGALHPIGDSLAAFRMPLCVVAWPLWLLCLSRRIWWRTGPVLALVSALAAWPYLRPSPVLADAPIVTLYQKNMLWNGQGRAALFDDIRQSGADFVTLQEVNPRNLSALQDLQSDYPHSHYCGFDFVGGTMILSRRPILRALDCVKGLSGVQVPSEAGPVWVIAVHVSWPYPWPQGRHIDSMMTGLADVDGPVILAGDFNMSPWGYQIGRLLDRLQVHQIGATRGTFDLYGLVPLPLDHVHASWPGRLAAVRPKLGGDHRGLVAQIVVPQ